MNDRPVPPAAGEPDRPELTTRQLLTLLLPALGVAVGVGLWLWSRGGLAVWLGSASAFLAGCLG